MKVLNLKFDQNSIQSLFQVDLDDITTKSIRLRLEADLNEKFDELKVGELTNVTSIKEKIKYKTNSGFWKSDLNTIQHLVLKIRFKMWQNPILGFKNQIWNSTQSNTAFWKSYSKFDTIQIRFWTSDLKFNTI